MNFFALNNLTGLQNIAQPRCAAQQAMLRYPPGYQSTHGITPQHLILQAPPQMPLSITDISSEETQCPDAEGSACGQMVMNDSLQESSRPSEGAANKAIEAVGNPHGQPQNVQSNEQQQQLQHGEQDCRDPQQLQNQINKDELHCPNQQNDKHCQQNRQQQLRQQKVEQNKQQSQHLPQVFVFGQGGQGTMPSVGFGFDKKLNEGSQSKGNTDISCSESGDEPPLPLQNKNNGETCDGNESQNGACSDDTDSPKSYAQATSSGNAGKGSSNQNQQQGKNKSIFLTSKLTCVYKWMVKGELHPKAKLACFVLNFGLGCTFPFKGTISYPKF